MQTELTLFYHFRFILYKDIHRIQTEDYEKLPQSLYNIILQMLENFLLFVN
jgi:hypothetical protein